ncbi:branched-chain amino acid aminotransferase [Thiomicrospira sp. XS5]|uniref:branched-chain-amino-acid transaminase n=1 Tax=Thiomicrospira sp. XS5 TaxID=1775636 RepID=UPI0007480BD3|nr:branched-chain-amino-acid transaminase [Thiomicrospira sp. XS5]KUJ74969.1 branched-chain amino acid aminotransferase [Thiomicrospira sp. XS5]
MERQCWINQAIKPVSQAGVALTDHGLLYGDGVFEGIRFYHRVPFLLTEHLERLFQSAKAICLELPYSMDDLHQACRDVIAQNDLTDGYLRLVVTRGSGALGLDPSRCETPTVFILCDELKVMRDSAQSGLKLIVAATRRMPLDVFDSQIKTLNYMNNILAKIEANQAGADDALLLNTQGRVAEASAANVFLVEKGKLASPPSSECALNGITRRFILELAASVGIECVERPLSLYDVYQADEVFLSGSGAEMLPVADIGGRRMTACPGPVFKRLKQAFDERVQALSES